MNLNVPLTLFDFLINMTVEVQSKPRARTAKIPTTVPVATTNLKDRID